MNYEPNTTHWHKGDIVLHDSDAKEPKMLMRVIGYTRDGLCKTQYIDRSRHTRQIYKNELRYLHDAARFGLREQSRQEDWERVHLWNYHYAVGTRVRVKKDITDEIVNTTTRTCAQLIKGELAWVWLDGIVGAYLLSHVEPLEPPNTPERRELAAARPQRDESEARE